MPLQATSGAASYDAFGGGVPIIPEYIEEVFSTFLHTGNGGQASQTITNGIDLAGKGGLVWIKSRSNALPHEIVDTSRAKIGQYYPMLNSATTNADTAGDLTTFNNNGFTVDNSTSYANNSPFTYCSWTFRKQPKFFDIQTWTGTGSNTTISHALGSVPACIIVKRTDTGQAWAVYHRSLANTEYLVLNTTAAKATGATWWNSTTPTSTVFSVGTDASVNASGGTYVAYIFAHDAGGFGLTGTDNVISCGSYTGNGSTSGPSITLGYEPQWIMIKNASAVGYWRMFDNMRGMPVSGSGNSLEANTSAAEAASDPAPIPNATGFSLATTNSNLNGNGNTMIYIAIRRGPMKVPTDATTVFKPIATTTGTQTTNFPIDLQISNGYSTTDNKAFSDRLRGFNSPNGVANQPWLNSTSTNAELTNASLSRAWNNTGFLVPPYYDTGNGIYYNFRRAPSFFDEVCYTGNGTYANRIHNLTVAPEMAITKRRNGVSQWVVIYAISPTTGNYLTLETTSAANFWGATGFTTTEFGVADDASAQTYVTYLFATCAGVSKVGSYTGNGTTQTINCGFTGGARFVLIKRTDSTGDWYVYDTARGMTVLTDPYLQLNNTNAEVATLGSVTTVATGFALNSAILANINVSAGTYIFLAIA